MPEKYFKGNKKKNLEGKKFQNARKEFERQQKKPWKLRSGRKKFHATEKNSESSKLELKKFMDV